MSGLRRFSVRKTGVFLLGLAHEDEPLVAVELGPVLLGDVVLALSLGEGDQGDLVLLRRSHRPAAMKALLMGSMSAEEAKVSPRWKRKKAATPRSVCSRG